MTAPSEGIFIIEKSLKQLASEREEAEYQGDSEALVVIDKKIAEYLTKEAAKVTSYVALIQKDEMTVEACKRQIERYSDFKKAAEARIERMKANALATMQQFGVTELKATPGGGLRRQGNGGLQPLELRDWEKDSSGRYVPLKAHIATQLPDKFKIVLVLPNTERIREAIRNGDSVPGAELLPRGEHVRII